MNRTRLGIFLKSSAPHSGPGRYVRTLLNSIDPREFDVVLFAPPEFQAASDELRVVNLQETDHEESMNVAPEAELPAKRSRVKAWARELVPFDIRYSLGFSREARRLAGLLHPHRLNVFHTSDIGREESAIAARLAGIPSVIGTLHVLPDVDVDGQHRRWIHRHLERRGVHALDRAIAVSDAGRNAWMQHARMPADRIQTIHNGIDTEYFRRCRPAAAARQILKLPDDDAIVLGTMARLTRVKGLGYLIQAAALLKSQGRPVRVVIAGEGPLLEDLKQCAARAEVAVCAHFIGHQDARLALEALDVFVLPSLSEALPFAVMEAMAMELPVVASNVGGVPEIVGSGGVLVPAADAAALAAALSPLVESANLRERMGRSARQRILKSFDERRMAQETLSLYRSMRHECRACA